MLTAQTAVAVREAVWTPPSFVTSLSPDPIIIERHSRPPSTCLTNYLRLKISILLSILLSTADTHAPIQKSKGCVYLREQRAVTLLWRDVQRPWLKPNY